MRYINLRLTYLLTCARNAVEQQPINQPQRLSCDTMPHTAWETVLEASYFTKGLSETPTNPTYTAPSVVRDAAFMKRRRSGVTNARR